MRPPFWAPSADGLISIGSKTQCCSKATVLVRKPSCSARGVEVSADVFSCCARCDDEPAYWE